MTDTSQNNKPAGDAALGISGRLTRAFIGSPLTPLMLMAAIALGLILLLLSLLANLALYRLQQRGAVR